MKTDKKTPVKFYVEKFGQILAVFPTINERNGYRNDLKLCYSHNGQHSTAAPEYIKKCTKATPEQYLPLLQELESIGYKLKIL